MITSVKRLDSVTPAGGIPGKLRLAVYGHVSQGSGSSPASHYVMMREILEQGHEVDLYAIANFILAGNLAAFQNFHYRAIAIPWADFVLHSFLLRLPRWFAWVPAQLFNFWRHAMYYRKIEMLVSQRHAQLAYDALLVLDVISPFRSTIGPPVVNWPPGSPLGELEGLYNCRRAFVQYSSRWLYYGLVAYYRIRVALARRLRFRCNQLICCSRWTAGCWQRLGFQRDRIAVVPFCLDFESFTPQTPHCGSRDITFFHLGRIVPRKRLDLLIEAFQLLQVHRPAVKLLIVGGFDYAKGYRQLVAPGKAPRGMEYRERVPREQIPDLLRSVDVLVQPSENEDFGSAVMEALGSGLPVVVGPSNGTGEYAGCAAIHFSEYTAAALACAMQQAMDRVDCDRSSVAAAARQAALDAFQPSRVAQQVISILHNVRTDSRPAATPCVSNIDLAL
jgi:glycosyltransferase involved in cell wall biosynthesis